MTDLESRFLYRERILSPEESAERWKSEYEYLIAVRDAAQRDLDEHLESAPVLRVVEQVELNPGDEGYDSASVGFAPTMYQGTVQWKNIP